MEASSHQPSHEGQQVFTHDLEGHALVAAVGAGVPEVVRHLPGHWNIWNMGKCLSINDQNVATTMEHFKIPIESDHPFPRVVIPFFGQLMQVALAVAHQWPYVSCVP